jgi:dienelactone hydrolase
MATETPRPVETSSPQAPGALAGFSREPFTSSVGETHDVYRLGTGPAVIVIHEVPGVTPRVIDFARRVAAHGFTAVVPTLLGTPGRAPTAAYSLASIARACVSREFTLLALNRTSPITAFLRELAREEHLRCGGRGVGAVGMCLTGGFALAMCVEPSVIAPVLSQPSLPLPVGARRRAAPGLSDDDLATVVARSREEGLCALALRFSGDAKAPEERFDRLRRELGPNFIGVEIDSSPANAWGYAPNAHSVLTEDYSDAAGSPTREALGQVLAFLADRLVGSTPD